MFSEDFDRMGKMASLLLTHTENAIKHNLSGFSPLHAWSALFQVQHFVKTGA